MEDKLLAIGVTALILSGLGLIVIGTYGQDIVYQEYAAGFVDDISYIEGITFVTLETWEGNPVVMWLNSRVDDLTIGVYTGITVSTNRLGTISYRFWTE